jgi:hypothetical protein
VSQNERVLERRPLEDRKGADGEETERRRKKDDETLKIC